MRRTNDIAFLLLGLIVSGILVAPAAVAQNAAPVSLKDQLEAQYTLTKTGLNSGELTVTQPGTVLVIQQAGIEGAPPRTVKPAPSIYKDGVLKPPTMKAKIFDKARRGAMYTVDKSRGLPDSRDFEVGEKVYVTKLDVDVKQHSVGFHIIECDSCNGATQPSSYEAEVAFDFPKGSLANPNVTDIEDTIAKVFTIDTSTAEPRASQGGDQQGNPGNAQAQGLSNDDIIKLVQMKLGDSVIIAKIKSSPCAFETSVDGIAKLKQAGVSDVVLQAMVEKQ